VAVAIGTLADLLMATDVPSHFDVFLSFNSVDRP
jgi:hypothetical protein